MTVLERRADTVTLVRMVCQSRPPPPPGRWKSQDLIFFFSFTMDGPAEQEIS